jgi:L-serine dehydratase
MYRSLQEAVRDAEAQGTTLAAVALAAECADGGRPVADVRASLKRALDVMRGAVAQGLTGELRSASGLVGGDAAKLVNGPPGPLAGTPFRDVLARALAVQEVNAAMGVIVAAPTAAARACSRRAHRPRRRARPRDEARRRRARHRRAHRRGGRRPRVALGRGGRVSGETGAAAGMAAGAATEMLGGTPRQALHAVALAQQGTLGLVCDPLGGLVELPCVFRNATGAAIALAAIEMALAGIEFAIPADEVIDTMGEIGRSMDVRYRETAGGGLAATPTGRRLRQERLVQIKRGD